MSEILMPFPPNLRFCELHSLSQNALNALSDLQAECLDEAWSSDVLADMIENQSAFGFGLFEEESCIGFCIYLPCAENCELVSIAMAPTGRGLGLGLHLLNKGEAISRTKGFERILLEVATDNEPARKLYAADGYAQDGVRKRYYRRPNGPACDAILMSKPIK